MAKVRPFAAYRPNKGLAAEIAALPYDVYSRDEACEAVRGRPHSFLRIDRAETSFDDSVDAYDDRVYEKANALFRAWIDRDDFIREEKPVYYIYALTADGRTQTGLVLCASIDDYLNGVIRKHENTRAEKELDRIRHVDALSAQTGPIFLAYRREKRVAEVIARCQKRAPLYDFTSEDGVRHTVWTVDGDADIERITEGLARVPHLYIADGHHRAASAVKVGLQRRAAHPGYTGEEEFNYFLSVLFPEDELRILDYNRVVRDLNGLGEAAFLERLSAKFAVERLGAAEKPREKGEIGMYLSGKWYRLTAKAEIRSGDPVEGLDVSVLQNEVLGPILGIGDPKTDARIAFVGGIRGLAELERRAAETGGVAFAMYPTTVEELFTVADAGRLMPPKSTWFEPKLRSGLFIHTFER